MYKDRPRIKLERTELDRILNLLMLILVVLHIVYVAVAFKGLPETIATHFNWQGIADGWGSKFYLWLLPGVSLITYISLTILSKYPHIFNYLVKITEENAERQYKTAVQMIQYTNLIVLILFFYISYMSISSSTVNTNAQSANYTIYFIIGGLFVLIGFYILKAFKYK